MPETRKIDLDQATRDAGLGLLRQQEAAVQAYQDWLDEQRRAYGVDREGEQVSFNPFTGRLTAVLSDAPVSAAPAGPPAAPAAG